MTNLVDLKWPVALVLLSILFGTGMGVVFGVQEDALKSRIADQLQYNQNLSLLSSEVQEKEKENLKNKAWQYVKRAHMHGGGIAALSLGVLLVLASLNVNCKIKFFLGFILAFGGFLYPFFWLAAAFYTPSLGAAAAKEKFQFLAGGGVLHVVATFIILIMLITKGFKPARPERGEK